MDVTLGFREVEGRSHQPRANPPNHPDLLVLRSHMPPPTPNMPPPGKTLECNIIWIELRDAGGLARHDYDAALAFLPGMHRQYNTIGTGAPILGNRRHRQADRLRRPRRTRLRDIAVMAYYMFVVKIDEPEPFSSAMENVRRMLRKPAPKASAIHEAMGKV
ncbi:hypothetical protein DFP72DRAFT_1062589 [Ephemerocybe angulata]|uniref:Uncharacterized protein n=1 Tax=Ephemerocybe angulata TaxID=980116 RepID=A0A8H6MCI8_9AGAR|nr:hypothetical protein DFP72DRAFT_1062589 [Tulosesus angulatus]